MFGELGEVRLLVSESLTLTLRRLGVIRRVVVVRRLLVVGRCLLMVGRCLVLVALLELLLLVLLVLLEALHVGHGGRVGVADACLAGGRRRRPAIVVVHVCRVVGAAVGVGVLGAAVLEDVELDGVVLAVVVLHLGDCFPRRGGGEGGVYGPCTADGRLAWMCACVYGSETRHPEVSERDCLSSRASEVERKASTVSNKKQRGGRMPETSGTQSWSSSTPERVKGGRDFTGRRDGKVGERERGAGELDGEKVNYVVG